MGGTTTTFGRPPWPLEGTRATAHVACGERRPQGRQRRAAGCARAAGLGRAVAPRGRGPEQGPICASARAGRAREVPGGHQARLPYPAVAWPTALLADGAGYARPWRAQRAGRRPAPPRGLFARAAPRIGRARATVGPWARRGVRRAAAAAAVLHAVPNMVLGVPKMLFLVGQRAYSGERAVLGA